MLALVTRVDDAGFRDAVLATARALRLLGLVLERLTTPELQRAVDPATLALLTAARRIWRAHAAAQDLELDRVLQACARRGIAPMLLKGAALRRAYYRPSCARAMGDVDLLVPAMRVGDAIAALADAGYDVPDAYETSAYSQFHFHYRLVHPRGHVVELHWALTEPDAPYRLDAAAFLRHARTRADARATAACVAAPEDLVLHLTAQHAADPIRALARAVDIDRIAHAEPAMDWDRVAHDARAGGMTTALWTLLTLAHELLDAPVPVTTLHRARPSVAVRAHLQLLRLAPRAAGATTSSERELRLLQLWSLLGDHPVRVVVGWLVVQGFMGPHERVTNAARSRWHRWGLGARDLLGLARAQAGVYGSTVAL